MNQRAFQNALSSGAESLEIELSSAQLDQFWSYQVLLERWAPKVNLVAEWDGEKTVGVHFLDAIAVQRVLPQNDLPVVDVGSGAGFPGLVLAILNPEREFTLAEPIGKRGSFLQQVLIAGGIQNCRIELLRTNQILPKSQRIATARAVFAPKQWLKEAARIVDEDGWAIVMTAEPLEQQELDRFEKNQRVLERVDSFTLPIENCPRTNSLFRIGG